MSKRFFLMLGLGVAMALTGVILSLRPDFLGSGSEGAFDRARGAGGEPRDAAPRRGGNGVSTTAGRTVPAMRITVDGQRSDWARIDESARHRRDISDTGAYRCKTVQFARDRENLYVLLELAHGVDGRFQASRVRKGDRPFSGNLPDIDFLAEGREFSLRLATGYSIIRGPAPTRPTLRPLVKLEVFRHDAKLTSVFSASSRDRGGAIAFAGKTIEVKLPLASLGLARGARVGRGFE